MILKLRDRTEIILSKSEAEAVEQMIDQGKEFIKIGPTMIRRTEISSIQEGGITEGDKPIDVDALFANDRTLPAPATPQYQCGYAGTSIQHEINQLIKQRYPTKLKMLADKALRNKIYQELLKKYPNKFCDYKTGAHYCLPNSPQRMAV